MKMYKYDLLSVSFRSSSLAGTGHTFLDVASMTSQLIFKCLNITKKTIFLINIKCFIQLRCKIPDINKLELIKNL